MLAIKKYLYEPGVWNNFQVYHYDFDDPLGAKIANKLIPNYLFSKKGNCVSMPILFIILGQKIEIKVTASEAPLHVFVKYTDDATGTTYNLETTSGANPARDEWYQQEMPMTNEAIANGIYLKALTKKEAVVVMATVLLEFFPKNITAILWKGGAYAKLLDRDFLQKYRTLREIPVNQRSRFQYLADNNQLWFDKAESLGWRKPSQEDEKNYLRAVNKADKFHN